MRIVSTLARGSLNASSMAIGRRSWAASAVACIWASASRVPMTSGGKPLASRTIQSPSESGAPVSGLKALTRR